MGRRISLHSSENPWNNFAHGLRNLVFAFQGAADKAAQEQLDAEYRKSIEELCDLVRQAEEAGEWDHARSMREVLACLKRPDQRLLTADMLTSLEEANRALDRMAC